MNYQIFANSLQIIGIYNISHAFQNKIYMNGWYARANWQCFVKIITHNGRCSGGHNWPKHFGGCMVISVSENRPISQIPAYSCPLAYNALFRTKCACFCSESCICWIWNRCSVWFVRLVHCETHTNVIKTFSISPSDIACVRGNTSTIMHDEFGVCSYNGSCGSYAASCWQPYHLIPQLGTIPMVITYVHSQFQVYGNYL